jgi:hypothetical protein
MPFLIVGDSDLNAILETPTNIETPTNTKGHPDCGILKAEGVARFDRESRSWQSPHSS